MIFLSLVMLLFVCWAHTPIPKKDTFMSFANMFKWAATALQSDAAKKKEIELFQQALTHVSDLAKQKAPDYAPAIDTALQTAAGLAIAAISSKTK